MTLAFDALHHGESGGEPRNIEVPSTRVEDFSAAVDFLNNHPLVDENGIGVLGICGGGEYAISAAQIDPRIKAIATVSMFDMGRARRQGVGDTISYEQRMKTLEEIGKQCTREARGEPRWDTRVLRPGFEADSPEIVREFLDYYATPRGQHPNLTSIYSFTSLAPMMISSRSFRSKRSRPGRPDDRGRARVSAYLSEDAYSKAAEPKELFVVPGASHIDLYGKLAYVAKSLEKPKIPHR